MCEKTKAFVRAPHLRGCFCQSSIDLRFILAFTCVCMRKMFSGVIRCGQECNSTSSGGRGGWAGACRREPICTRCVCVWICANTTWEGVGGRSHPAGNTRTNSLHTSTILWGTTSSCAQSIHTQDAHMLCCLRHRCHVLDQVGQAVAVAPLCFSVYVYASVHMLLYAQAIPTHTMSNTPPPPHTHPYTPIPHPHLRTSLSYQDTSLTNVGVS